MITTKKINVLICAFIAVLFFSSCESDDPEIEPLNQLAEAPLPISLEELKEKSFESSSFSSNKALGDNIATWGTVEGAYFEKQGNSVLENPNQGSVIGTFPISLEGINYTYITNVSNNQLIALPTWSINNLALAYIQNTDTKAWLPYMEVRYAVQQSSNFEIEFSSLTDRYATARWDRTAFAGFRYDIFLQGEKIEENLNDPRALYVFRRLEQDTFYAVKIIAKSDDGSLRIRYVSFRTPKAITISNFDMTLNNISTNGLSISWTAPVVTNTSELEYRIVVGSKQFFTTETSIQVNDITPISLDIHVIVEAIAGNQLYSTRLAKHSDFRLSGQPVEDNSISFYAYQASANQGIARLEWNPPSAPDGKDFNYAVYVNETLYAQLPKDVNAIDLYLYSDVNPYDSVSIQAIFANGTSATSRLTIITEEF
ncbi:hypothetical protein [Aquimarina algiphila]|uniref:Fibronectin type III domain-containing protein n=1 Tax=Aquimarina algiphila TaxID=2047982 RepID=A0A554VN84_9FLAO|nr:hypothetical protein [Aquimarina algiphila]TSE09802.1 hypothetical protein FOF46_07245 [Aquimarina algiphila]